MNNRIKELVTQATRPRGPAKPAEFDKEYFAELLVKECAEVGRLAVERAEQFAIRAVPDYVDLKIKEHFGVEE